MSSSTRLPWPRKCSATAVADHGGAQPLQRRLVAGGDHHHRAGQAGAQVALDELADLAPALADQPDHHHVGRGAAGQHAEQHRLADAGAGHDGHALPLAHGEAGVDGADAQGQRLGDAAAGEGRRRHGVERGAGRAGAAAGRRPPAAGPRPPPGPSRPSPTGSRSPAVRGTTSQPSPMPWISPSGMRRATPLAKPTTSAVTTRPPSVPDLARGADRHVGQGGLDDQAGGAGHRAGERRRVGLLQHALRAPRGR